jgi:hypothetical protein
MECLVKLNPQSAASFSSSVLVEYEYKITAKPGLLNICDVGRDSDNIGLQPVHRSLKTSAPSFTCSSDYCVKLFEGV